MLWLRKELGVPTRIHPLLTPCAQLSRRLRQPLLPTPGEPVPPIGTEFRFVDPQTLLTHVSVPDPDPVEE